MNKSPIKSMYRPSQLFFFIILIGIISACNSDETAVENTEQEDRTPQSSVETVTVTPGSFDDYFRLTGTVEALEDATISSETNGRIMSILSRGETVAEGEAIAQIDDRLIRSQYESAQTAYELAEDSFNRLESLYADSIISTQDFNAAQAQRDQARAQLNQAEKQLDDANINAPFNGRVEERFVRTGELISPGMPVVRLVNTDKVLINAGVPERYSSDIIMGTPVRVNFTSYEGEAIETKVSFIGNVIDPNTRTFPVEIEINNANANLKPEMVAEVQMKRRTIDNAIIIPRTAIVRDENAVNVFIARAEEGRKIAELVQVQTGRASGALIEIVKGLSEGDEVIVAGMRTLSVGDRLNILKNSTSVERAQELQRSDSPTTSF
ncbi:MAG: efflux RND transporter periplasmic adaptor subunit [Balneolaceae bacterium]